MKKREFSAEYKAKIAIEISKEEKTISEIGSRLEWFQILIICAKMTNG